MADDKHAKALDLTEKALEEMDKGNDAKADALVAEAKKLDPSAPAEVVHDMEEDAASKKGG